MFKWINILLTCLMCLAFVLKAWWFAGFIELNENTLAVEGLEVFATTLVPFIILVVSGCLKFIALRILKLPINLAVGSLALTLAETIVTVVLIELLQSSNVLFITIVIIAIVAIFLLVKMLIREVKSSNATPNVGKR